MKKVRYGLLSTARISRTAHVPAALKSSNSEITAVCSRGIEKADNFAKELGINKSYGSYEELLQDPEIDAVINPLPINMHCDWTIKAAEAGKHILCEKPFAFTVKEARRMIEAAEKNNVLVMEAFTHRFKPEVEFLREMVKSGKLGMVRTIYSDLVYPLKDMENDTRIKKELGGGALMDCGCYSVSIIRYILGEDPLSVNGCRSMYQPNDIDATFCGSLLFPGGCMAAFFSSQQLPFRASIEITGDHGRAGLNNFFTGNRVDYVINKEQRQEAFDIKDRFVLQLEHFSECILEGKKPRFSPEDAVRNTAVLAALRKAAETGRTISVEY